MPNRLKEWRIKRGMTQQELADKLNTTHSQIQHLENGRRKLTEDWLIKISAALNIKITDLLKDAQSDSPVPLIGLVDATDEVTLLEKPEPVFADRLAASSDTLIVDVVAGNLNGFRLYLQPTELERGASDQKAFVRLKTGKCYIVRKIIKGQKPGVNSLLLWQSGTLLEDVKIEAVYKISWLGQK